MMKTEAIGLNSARSIPVKWVANIASSAGLASGVHYCIALAEKLAPWVRIANYVATAVIFVVGT